MTPEEKTAHDALIAQLKAEIEKAVPTADIAALKTKLAELEAKSHVPADYETVKTEVVRLAAELKAMAEKGGNNTASFQSQLNKAIAENIDKIKAIKAAGSGVVEFQLKAVADITTANGTNTSPPAITGTQQAPLQNVGLRGANILALTSNVSTSLAAYPYTEATPKDGDYAFLAEGSAKPQVDFEWKTEYAKPVKTAAWIRLSDESVQDVEGLQSVANDFLRKKHDLKKQRGILFGDGNSPNPKGATKYGRAFVAGDMAGLIDAPNFMDVVNAGITDIFTTHNYEDETPYMANIVLINPIDFFVNLVSAKTLNGEPLYPSAGLFNQVTIGGVTILPEEMIPAGKIFICDMGKYNTTDYLPYTVKIGYVNDDLIKNQFVILGESRFHAFVRTLDEQAFIYDDIAVIRDAIAAI